MLLIEYEIKCDSRGKINKSNTRTTNIKLASSNNDLGAEGAAKTGEVLRELKMLTNLNLNLQ